VESSGNAEQKTILEDEHQRKLLFATACMEWAHDRLFEFLISGPPAERIDAISPKKIAATLDSGALGEGRSIDPALPLFAVTFHRLIDRDRDGGICASEVRALENVLSVIAITSVSETPEVISRWAAALETLAPIAESPAFEQFASEKIPHWAWVKKGIGGLKRKK
jgi:hypothetical protein